MNRGKRDKWEALIRLACEDDGLPTRPVGEWTADKLYFWHQYVGITTKAMVGKRGWAAGVCYVDLFAGPGICTIRGTDKRFPGSALIAAHAPKPFTKILLAEMDPATARACSARMDKTPAASSYRMFEGDCNQRIGEIAAAIPDKALTIAVIDPPGLDIEFQSIRTLSERGRVDLLILFADAMDAVRNLDRYTTPNSRLDKFLGPGADWRKKLSGLPSSSKFRETLLSIYIDQLRRLLGYEQFGHETIKGPRGPLYRLVYASKHRRGLEFWNTITRRDRSGQQELF